MTRTLIAGNWKMNGTRSALDTASAMAKGLANSHSDADALICPPANLVMAMAEAVKGTKLHTGGQDCHTNVQGAHTGDISAEMLRDAGASYVIVGHSERRADHGESDALIAAKTEAALGASLIPIICIGETLEQRENGETLTLITKQLAGSIPDACKGQVFVVAYEPVWAIGTGKTASLEQIGEIHDAIRGLLKARFDAQGTGVPILYGGSMKPTNAAEILAVSNVNGGLIGGASLNADDFLAIYKAAEQTG